VGKLKYLFQPLRIGSMEVKNRVMMPAMGIGFLDEEGCVTSQLIEFYSERARSEPGMIMPSAIPVQPLGANNPNMLRMVPIWDDKTLHGLERMVAAVHTYDVRFGAQLLHMGIRSGQEETVGPSAVLAADGVYGNLPREMSRNEIKECIKAFGAAAERCVKAGFDFVEIHAAHGYLISQFLTPYYNRRTDEYGGDFNNRIRFLLEIIHEVRVRLGSEIPIGVRINGDDFIQEGRWTAAELCRLFGFEEPTDFPQEGGWTLAQLCRLAPILEEASVDYLNITTGVSYDHTVPPIYREQGEFAYISEEVKKHVSIPVVIRGRIKNPIMADDIVGKGKADMVAMGRAQIADAEMVEKARKGDIAEIRLCIADCRGCSEGILRYGEISCAVNPRVGREYLIKDVEGGKIAAAKRVLVAGAGCAGLEAARRAALAGHRVILCESRGWIGGQLRLAAMIPKRQEMGDIMPWYERQLNKLGVEIRLNTLVDDDLLSQIGPDVLVIATGSLPEVPLGYIKGLENIKDIELVMADELLEEQLLTGDNVLVVGGDQIGLQVADYLSERHKKVYVAERGAQFAEKMAFQDRAYLVGRIIDKAVERRARVNSVEILANDEVWMVYDDARERLPRVDTIVLASDRRPNIFLAEVAEKRGIETQIIGDASGVTGEDQGTVLSAVASGYEVGRQV